MNTITAKATAPASHGLGRILTISALAAGLIGTAAGPSLAEGDYVAGPTASAAWTASAARTPLAAFSAAQPFQLLGGDDQYVAGASAWSAWPRAESRTPLARPATPLMNFHLEGQGN
ncbi:hypothetical protein [Muricoccus vinaceus]|uniref:Uncharacterized protein n=1 Tax=Muricoccus vinaceus TaxID=424704 RepID=A0ABV6IPS5_9PROT